MTRNRAPHRYVIPFRAFLRRTIRSRVLWRALAVLVVCEGLAASAWLTFLLDRSPGHIEFGAALLATQFVALVAFLCGGRAEQRRAWFTRLSRARESRRSYYEPSRVWGDPALARRANALRPPRQFVTLTSPEQMCDWREAIRREIIDDLYPDAFAPDEETPTIQMVREVALGQGVSRALVTYEAADSTTIPAYLFRPRIDEQAPAALVIPGHGRGIVETAGLVRSYQNGVALALAQAGFVTLTPELRGFGHLGEVLGTNHHRVALRALMCGTSYYAVVLHDLRRGLTALLRHPAVAPARVAVTGCSLGGDLSVTLGALDTRVQVVVAQGLCRWHGERGQRPTPEEDGSALTQDACGIIPDEARVTHYEDRYLLLAPRPFAVINGKGDVGEMHEEGSWLLSLLREAYCLEGAGDRFWFSLTQGGHEYHLQPAIGFLRHHFC